VPVQLWSLADDGDLGGARTDLPVPVVVHSVPRGGPRWRRLAHAARFGVALRRARVRAVVAFGGRSNVVASLARPLAGHPAVVWNERSAGIDDAWPDLHRAARRFPTAWVANSDEGADHLVRRHDPAGGVRVIVNGVRLDPPTHDRRWWRAELAVADDAPVAIMAANLTWAKDHTTALDAWSRLGDHSAVLVLAGRPEGTEADVARLVDELGLEERVRRPGPVTDMSGLLGAADLAVLSSRREGTPNAVLEAMAAGLPVVASDLDPIRRALGADAGRWLVPPGDPAALAAAVDAVLADLDAASRVGAASAERVAARYSVEAMADAFAAVAGVASAPPG
jgi:glycosyltransferase involved in cell wall biosynthesis